MSRKESLITRTLSISCIVPVHNEQAGIQSFLRALVEKIEQFAQRFEIIVVDDGSRDDTALIVSQMTIDHRIKLISFSRNFGKENALTAGLQHCDGAVAILIDADFQHPLEVIDAFLEKWVEGFDMVYGEQENRATETLIRRSFAKLFYQLMQLMTNTNIPPNAGDFRLLDKQVVLALRQLKERGRFMKGLYGWVGFRSTAVPFVAPERAAGKSSYRFSRLFELAITGITAFSDIPLRIWSLIGFIISAIAFAYGSIIIFDTLTYGIDVPGYATIVVAIMFFGGIQLLSIGILGEYLSRIFQEVKERPHYIISKKIGFDD